MTGQGVSSIYADHYQQGVLATRHLIERGHRDIGFLAIQPDEWGSNERLRGYQDTLAVSYAAAGRPESRCPIARSPRRASASVRAIRGRACGTAPRLSHEPARER